MRRTILPFLLIACSKQPADEPVEPVAVPLMSVVVEPADVLVESGPGSPGRVSFTATGTYEDGTQALLDVVGWELSNKTAGTIDDTGAFEAATTNGGITWVTATLDGVSGQATATVRYVQEVENPYVDSSWFDTTPSPVSGSWLYPEDEVSLPRNTPSIHWQWQDPATLVGAAPSEAYQIRFRSELTEIVWYTPDRELILDANTWATIASTNAGGEVEVTLAAATATQLLAEDPITVKVQRMDAEGSVIYWSTGAAGLVEIPFGGVAADYLTQAQTGRCVGCHAISRDNLIAFTWDGGNGGLGVRDMTTGADLYSSGGGNFSTFSPDGSMLLTASYGNLELKDPYTGALISVVANQGNATHPDWAKDDSAIVFTQTDGHQSDWTLNTPSRIAIAEHLGSGNFGPPQVIFEAPPGYRAYYPAWSPDSQWIAFNVSTGDAYDDVDAELWVMYRSGEFGAVKLDKANRGPNLTNSWPRWAPLPDDDVLWLTFASRRPYGGLIDGVPQIWVSAIDPGALAAGQDPSSPAFWLPGQPTTTGNHIPVWIE